MAAIGFTIGDIVDEIYGTRECAKHDEGSDGPQRCGPFEETPSEEEPGKQEQVLGPLLGPQGHEEPRRGGSIRERGV